MIGLLAVYKLSRMDELEFTSLDFGIKADARVAKLSDSPKYPLDRLTNDLFSISPQHWLARGSKNLVVISVCRAAASSNSNNN